MRNRLFAGVVIWVTLYNEIKTKYPEAVDHSGNLLVDSFKAEQQ
jgi:hypothetical protein